VVRLGKVVLFGTSGTITYGTVTLKLICFRKDDFIDIEFILCKIEYSIIFANFFRLSIKISIVQKNVQNILSKENLNDYNIRVFHIKIKYKIFPFLIPNLFIKFKQNLPDIFFYIRRSKK